MLSALLCFCLGNSLPCMSIFIEVEMLERGFKTPNGKTSRPSCRWHHGACVGFTEEDEAQQKAWECAACAARR